MKDKIEVGDYVRTKYGIAKVEKVEVDKPHKTIWYTVDKAQYYCFLVREQEVIKSSKNIIDLIEVGDYVNGEIVKKDNLENLVTCTTIISNGFYNTPETYMNKLDKIETIVTKEQYKQIEYIVEE